MVLARAWRSRRGTGKIEDGGGWMDGWVAASSVEASEKGEPCLRTETGED